MGRAHGVISYMGCQSLHAKRAGCKKLFSFFHCRLTKLNSLALTRMESHWDTHGQLQCRVSWRMIGLHGENEAKFKMFMKVQIKLANQENQVYSLVSSPIRIV